MARVRKSLQQLMGVNVSGDYGPLTMYKSDRGQIVFFPRYVLSKAPSFYQHLTRNAFRAAAASWRALPAETRARWDAATRAASLRLTGYNLWVYYQTRGDTAAIETIERQTGLQLLD